MNDDQNQNHNDDAQPVDAGPISDLDGIEIQTLRPASFEADESTDTPADDSSNDDGGSVDGDDDESMS
ncbi:MAG: hypothetical protein V4519_04980 [Patescibacteria group bacterium]